jgi:hypothetical protein
MKIFQTSEMNVTTNSKKDYRIRNLDEPNAEQDIQRGGKGKSVGPGESKGLIA